ncbi:MAG: hypothetical protein D3910_15130 [Candidatus Electrothrix sp. ATG2]|nr:hypothetical protein [Candidatus Electrothrix sp. ATG2]
MQGTHNQEKRQNRVYSHFPLQPACIIISRFDLRHQYRPVIPSSQLLLRFEEFPGQKKLLRNFVAAQ